MATSLFQLGYHYIFQENFNSFRDYENHYNKSKRNQVLFLCMYEKQHENGDKWLVRGS